MTYFGGAIKKSETFDVAILGVPYDEKSCFLRGPAKGPLAIREAWTEEEQDAWTELGIDLEEGLVKNLVQVGIRASIGAHWEKAAAHHVRMIEMKDFPEKLELVFDNPLYVSFDIDALDPAFAPGVSHRVPGGLSSRQAIAVLHALKAEIVGMDMVEVNPDRDASGITASAAAKIVMEIAGKIGQGIQRKEKEAES